jgi:DNA-directed RNA polymerase subunit alpha
MSTSGLDTVIGGSNIASDPQGAANHFKKGQELEKAGDRTAAITEYRAAYERDQTNAEHTFRLAYLLDLVGEEHEAMLLYQRLAMRSEPHINALVNLAVLHEDRGEMHQAERCLRKVLEAKPNHARARLFMKDVSASKEALYDEGDQRDEAKRKAELDTPVTDFELSVRSRNCLKKMNIRTLRDLLMITKAELLSYKNFGETSLTEIEAMLAQRGLRLGEGLDQGYVARAAKDYIDKLADRVDTSVLGKPVASMDLSVRARRALQLLGVQSVGELAARTEAELMGVKNFGQNSLDEIKRKLIDMGLSLRELD